MSRYYNQVLEINAGQRFARVQPGLLLDRLQDAARPHDLMYGPDPATHRWCTLGPARRLLRDVLSTLRTDIRAGTPIVGLEPSCVSVFRDELRNLYPHDEDARRLAGQVLTLAEFMQEKAGDYDLPKLERKAIVHGHCHHKSVMRMHADEALYARLGLDFDLLDSGCCGMAGAFGFEKGEKYRVSVGAGERVLLPAVRSAAPETLIVADGFSCREQIGQCTDREALHLAQVLSMAIRQGADGSRTKLGSSTGVGDASEQPRRAPHALPIALAGVAVTLVLGKVLSRRSS